MFMSEITYTLTINQEHVWFDHSALDFKHNFLAL